MKRISKGGVTTGDEPRLEEISAEIYREASPNEIS